MQGGARIVQMQETDIDAVATLEAEVSPAPWSAGIFRDCLRAEYGSVALRDALSGVDIPCIEVHISNVHAREPFRHHSYISDIAEAVISGLGSFGYDCALAAVLQSLDTHSTTH